MLKIVDFLDNYYPALFLFLNKHILILLASQQTQRPRPPLSVLLTDIDAPLNFPSTRSPSTSGRCFLATRMASACMPLAEYIWIANSACLAWFQTNIVNCEEHSGPSNDRGVDVHPGNRFQTNTRMFTWSACTLVLYHNPWLHDGASEIL